jgi:hypothetical protein
MTRCAPIIKPVPMEVRPQEEHEFSASCECGWFDPYIWSALEGARNAWVQHLVRRNTPWEVEL